MSGDHLLKPKYRPDIDGLRAIAVLSVVAYHAFPGVVRGGFVGVDVFFVISGYLISSIVLDSLAKDSFSFTEFYARRVKRIFPALAAVLAACCVAGWFTLMPDEYKSLGRHVSGGAGFVSNLMQWSESGYFDKAAEVKPLLHLWSLGIEEQFYIVWPLLLFLAWKKPSRFTWALGAIIILSFAYSTYETYTNAVAAFYSPFTRLWELAVGGALAYVVLFRPKILQRIRVTGRAPDYHAIAGLTLIFAAMVLLSTHSAFPGWMALLPALGTVLLIVAGPETWINRNFLSSRVFVFIGLISFPLYLWHWPLLSFARIIESGAPSTLIRLALVATSFLLAWMTYVLLETPIRFGSHSFAKVCSLVAAMGVIGCAGYAVFAQDGVTARVPRLLAARGTKEQARSAQLMAEYIRLKYDAGTSARAGTCWLSTTDAPAKYAEACLDATSPKPLVFVWGDSHAARLFAGMRQAIGDRFRLAEYTRDSCPPVLDFGYDICKHANNYIAEKVANIHPSILVMFGAWNRYGVNWEPAEECTDNLKKTIASVSTSGIEKIIFIGPAPQWKVDLPRNLLNIFRTGSSHTVPLRTTVGLVSNVQAVDAALADAVRLRPRVTYVSAFSEFCDSDGCLTRVNDAAEGLTTWDYGHLTTASAEYLARRLPVK